MFGAIQEAAAVDDAEMRRTFNMGVGFVTVVARDDVARAVKLLNDAGERVFEIAEIGAAERGVRYV